MKERISRSEKVAEAVSRMRELHLSPNIIDQFMNENRVCFCSSPSGNFFWATDADMKRIREKEFGDNILVYMGVRMDSPFGRMDSFLFVSDFQEDWEIERSYTAARTPLAYVYNHDSDLTEAGAIVVQLTENGGIVRVG